VSWVAGLAPGKFQHRFAAIHGIDEHCDGLDCLADCNVSAFVGIKGLTLNYEEPGGNPPALLRKGEPDLPKRLNRTLIPQDMLDSAHSGES
jgi:hypothetical protein